MQYVVLAALALAATVLLIDSARQKARIRRRPNVALAVRAALARPSEGTADLASSLRDQIGRSGEPDEDVGLWVDVSEALDPTYWRPKIRAGVEVRVFSQRWSDDYALIASPDGKDHYVLEPWEAELVPLMDGTRSIDELVVDRLTSDGQLDAPSVAGLVEMLRVCSLLEPPVIDVPASVKDRLDPSSPGRKKLREFGKTLRIGWDGAHAFTQGAYRVGLRWAFQPAAVAACALVAILGIACLVATVASHRFVLHLRTAPQETVILIGMSFVLTICHELAHALVLVHYRRRVISSGFMIFFGSPAFFVDASDGQMLDRRERIIQSFAGPWAELVLAGSACIVLFLFPGAVFAPLLYRFAVVNYFVIFENLVPLLRLDGYWILCDAIGEQDLRGKSLAFIQRDLWHKLRTRQSLSLRDGGLTLYGVVGSAYTVFSLWIGLYFWERVFGGIVGELWDGGAATRILLIFLVLAFVGPVIRGAIDAGRAVMRRVRALIARVRFRFERSWRVEAAELIDEAPGFSDLDEDLLGDLAGRVKLRTLPQGRALFRRGDRPDAFYVVRSGRVAVEDEDPDTGDVRLLRTMERGATFGELGLINMAPRAATVRAETPTQLFEIDKGTFDRLLVDSLQAPTFAPTMQAYASLRALPPFRSLAVEGLSYLLEHGTWESYTPGDLVIEEGAPGDAFYVIESGRVDVTRGGASVTTLGPGDHFGEVALLNDSPRNASVVAYTHVRAFRLDKDGFDNVVAENLRRPAVEEIRRSDREMEH